MNINVKFINFWPRLDENQWLNIWKKTFYHSNIEWINDNSYKPDLLISSVFGPIENINQFNCKKILYVRENLNHDNYYQYKTNLALFDLIIGWEDKNNQINVPVYYEFICNEQYKNYKINKKYSRRKNLCMISNNPHFLRLKLLDNFRQKNIKIDCPGYIGNNMNRVKDKINFIKDYCFNICPENSYATGYTTEKLFDCCISGCIPIYYGCERVNDGFYNKDRILHIKQDLSNYDEIIDKTIYLLNHKNRLLEFMNQDPFSPNKLDYITDVKEKIQYNLEKLLFN